MNAVSSHGTIIQRETDTPGTFVTIGGLGDLQPPSLSRNSFDTTTQNDDIDEYITGVLRRAEITFPINFRWDDPTHDHVSGLYKTMIDNDYTGYKVVWPDGTYWVLSGFVTNIAMRAPVDGAQQADVTIRPSGLMAMSPVGGTGVVTIVG